MNNPITAPKTSVMLIHKLLLCLIASCFQVQSQPILSTLRDYDAAKSQASNSERHQSITVADGVPYVHLAMLIALSQVTESGREAIKEGGYQGLAAGLLAIEHLNTGNGTLVEEVWGLNERCDIKFTAEIFDTGRSESESLNHAVGATSRSDQTQLPTAFIGGFRSVVSIATALVTGLRGIPQISPISTSSQLDNIGQFPLFGRTVPSDDGTAVPAILYLRNQLGVRRLAILHANDSYGNAYAAGLQKAAVEYAPDMTVESFSLPVKLAPEAVADTVTVLKNTRYQYFFGIFNTEQYKIVMPEAFYQGIAGDGKHNWMFADAVSTSLTRDGIDTSSPLALATQGAIRISAVGGVPGRDDRYDLFLQAMRNLKNPIDIATLQSYHPSYPDEPKYSTYTIEEDPDDFFDRVVIGLVPFLYDAVIALGLSACEIGNVFETSYFDGYQHFQKFKETQFLGASGNNRYHPDTGTRLAETARYSLTNFVHTGTFLGNKSFFDNVQTDIFQDGEWISVKSRIFNDGTTIPPPDLPPVEPNHIYIGRPLRVVVLVLVCSIWGLSIGFTIWMVKNRKTRVVKASQPIFLGLIALGCFLMGTSIVFLALDDEVVSTDTCSAFCIMVPWFFSFGWILSFSALFAKTKRVNKIFHNNSKYLRMKVTVRDVMAPIIILKTIATLLMIAWYIFGKPTWVRETTKEDLFGREIETRAKCDYSESAGFIASLGTLLVSVVGYTIQQAYKARKVSTEYAETEYIFAALASLLLVSFVGFPIVIIAKDDTRSQFFVSAAIIAVTSLSLLLLIFVPKVTAHRSTQRRSTRPRGRGPGLEFVSRSGSRRMKISGLSFKWKSPVGMPEPPKIDEEVLRDDSHMLISEPSRESKEGVAVIQHPMETEQLREKNEELKNWNKKLIAQNSRLEALLRKTQARLNMTTTPHDSVTLDKLSLPLCHPIDDSGRTQNANTSSPTASLSHLIHDDDGSKAAPDVES